MAFYARPPEYFSPGPDPAEAWSKWRRLFEIYYDAANMSSMQLPQQRALLLNALGEVGLNIYSTLTMNGEENARTVKQILDAFSEYYKPYKNTTFKRHEFFTAVQTTNQTVDEFVTELKQKASACDFADLTDSLIRDRLLCGLREGSLKTKLLRESNLTLSKAIDICRAFELAQKQQEIMQGSTETPVVDYMHGKPKKKYVHFSNQKIKSTVPKEFVSHQTQYPYKSPGQSSSNRSTQHSCARCGFSHHPQQCPAYGKICRKCRKRGHFANVCRSGTAHAITENPIVNEEVEEEDLFLGTLFTTPSRDWREVIEVNGANIVFKLDTGADVNILPLSVLNTIKNCPELTECKRQISTYSGDRLDLVGRCELLCKKKEITVKAEFYVVDSEAPPILGLQMCQQLQLIARIDTVKDTEIKEQLKSDDIIKKYQDVFEGIGVFSNVKYNIKLKEGSIPVIHPPRRLPLSLKERVKEELQRMKDLGIINEVHEATEWVHSMVVVHKPNGSLRICLDPRTLNEVILREHYPLPTIDELLTHVNKAKYFITLDAACAFWQVPLTEESSFLTTFATPFGRFRFLRLPYGLCSSPEVFQRAFSDVFADIDGVLIYMDDLLIWGSTMEEVLERFRRVLLRAREAGIKFSKEKLRIGLKEIYYLGNILSEKGLQISPQRVSAITSIQPPKNRKELQSFLGMVSYLSRFIENLSSKTTYLRQLVRQDVAFVWDDQAQTAFDTLKNVIAKAPTLQFYDSSKPVTISVDASKAGLGAVLSQDKGPIAYSSVALTDTQSNYASIERELLAVVHGLEHFRNYIYGQSVVVETDHKPLLAIVKKPYDQLSPRLQRMVLRLQRFQFSLTHVPGKQMFVADTLSRNPDKLTTINTDYLEGESGTVHLLVQATATRLQYLKNATMADPELGLLFKYLKDGWTNTKSGLPQNIQKYWPFKDELHESDGLIFKSNRLVIPATEVNDTLNRLHSAHQGIGACKAKARETVFWVSMNKDIEKTVLQCATCQAYQKANCKEPLQQHPIPTRPWEKVGVDLMALQGKHYIIVIDYFSKYIELQLLHQLTAPPVIRALQSFFARHGSPSQLFSDNGPPFNSSSFADFCASWDIEHQTASPGFPKSNGMCERAVQTVKGLLTKSLKEGQNPYKALLEYRATPHLGLPSPASLLMGRNIRSSLPTTDEHLKPNFDIETASKRLSEIQLAQRRHADKSSKALPSLRINQQVMYFHKPRQWLPAAVKSIGPAPRSYTIETPEGVQYRRNRIHLRPTHAIETREVPKPMAPVSEQEPSMTSCASPRSRPLDNRSTPILDNAGVRTRSGRLVKPLQRLICDV